MWILVLIALGVILYLAREPIQDWIYWNLFASEAEKSFWAERYAFWEDLSQTVDQRFRQDLRQIMYRESQHSIKKDDGPTIIDVPYEIVE